MKFELIGILVVIATIAVLCACFLSATSRHKHKFPRWRSPGTAFVQGEQIALANAEAEGTHLSGILSKRADGAIGRFLLVKPGSDEDHIVVATAADFPYGLTLDEGAVAEDLVQVQALCAGGTVKLQTDGSGALVAGDFLIPAAAGQVKKMAATVGQQYIVGQVIKAPATVAGTLFEARVMGCFNNTAVS